MTTTYLFKLANYLFAGFTISAIYASATGFAVWLWQPADFQAYVYAYAISFNCLTTSGIIVTAALFVFDTKGTIPKIIESNFERSTLEETRYFKYKRLYLSLFGAVTFSANYIIASYFIFLYSKFPFQGAAENFLIASGCADYALGVYVGRKLYFIAYMLGAISNARPSRNVFRENQLNDIISYVNILSTVTVIFVYVQVKSFYEGPFQYTSAIGPALKLLMLLPALIATPVVVIFNFYPRYVLRRLYHRAIAEEVDRVKQALKNEFLSEFERMSYAIEYDRIQKDELNNNLQLTLSDLPMGVTIVIMLIGLMVKA